MRAHRKLPSALCTKQLQHDGCSHAGMASVPAHAGSSRLSGILSGVKITPPLVQVWYAFCEAQVLQACRGIRQCVASSSVELASATPSR